VFVGRQVLLLEEGALARDELAIMITAMSDDAHVVAGFAYGKHTDPDVPNEPIIWRCR
jgi:hypothetical protein